IWEVRRCVFPKDGRIMFELEQHDLVKPLKIGQFGLHLAKWLESKMRHISYTTSLMKKSSYQDMDQPHCSKSNQLKMARYCVEIFGDILLSKPFDDYPLEPGVQLPSPNRLKRKILIKNKRLKADIEKLQMEQFLHEGKLGEEEEPVENP
ncbi:unnamed protein product, partial [Onchocerca ochengi]|uniref:phosphoinositide phospholipase C n=1 Tax=Onchocerca ochengi TaxID=42157 RepID=A0A182ESW2_ONCOC